MKPIKTLLCCIIVLFPYANTAFCAASLPVEVDEEETLTPSKLPYLYVVLSNIPKMSDIGLTISAEQIKQRNVNIPKRLKDTKTDPLQISITTPISGGPTHATASFASSPGTVAYVVCFENQEGYNTESCVGILKETADIIPYGGLRAVAKVCGAGQAQWNCTVGKVISSATGLLPFTNAYRKGASDMLYYSYLAVTETKKDSPPSPVHDLPPIG